MRPEVLVIPRVFTDRDSQSFAGKFDNLLRGCRREIALFVEDVVKGQQHLVLFKQDLTLVKQHGRRVTADYKLGKNRQPRSGTGCALTGGYNFCDIAGEVPYSWIDLGK